MARPFGQFKSLEARAFDCPFQSPRQDRPPRGSTGSSEARPAASSFVAGPIFGRGNFDFSGSAVPPSTANVTGPASFKNFRSFPEALSYDSENASVDGSSASGASSSDQSGSESSDDDENGELDNSVLQSHLRLLERRLDLDELVEIKSSPIFTEAVRQHAGSLAEGSTEPPFTQYGLLAGIIPDAGKAAQPDPRVFHNIAAPSSVFICGSQGSGKSHTMSCLLENCLMPSRATNLPRPLTGLVFHYDTFISDSGGAPCEVAYLSSNRYINVRVLCPPTNIRTIKKIYSRFPNITVEELRFNQADLNTKRMLDLMAVTSGAMPLYLHVINRILRDLRVHQQQTGSSFNYSAFKQMVHAETLTEAQLAPLKQRLDTLESFMVREQAKAFNLFGDHKPTARSKNAAIGSGNDWNPLARRLTIVDLSCPCVTSELACSLFNICLSLFLEQSSRVGRVIALDEAHKYMTDSPECQTLTESLLATIRLQRHLGARVIISTQEPTVSPKLLDLCSVTIVHHFTSPDWLRALKRHLAGVSSAPQMLNKLNSTPEEPPSPERVVPLMMGTADPTLELFSRIVALRVGEALLFAPSAIIGIDRSQVDTPRGDIRRLGHGVLKVRIRNRITADGGKSVMAA